MINKDKNSELSILYKLLGILGLIYLSHAIYFPGLFQEGDGIRHYLISRYSWKYPILLLELWGKPFFTLISSPFSQFGIMGIKFFNITCALLSCYFIFQIARHLKINQALLAPLFLGFTTLYFFMSISGFTEMLFGLILVYCIFLYLKEKYLFPTFLISFLPFVRSEGYLLLPLFFLVLILNRKFLTTLLLGLGSLVYSIIGYFVYHDFLWLQTQNPYKSNSAIIYGHGTFFHFFNDYSVIWGAPLTFLTFAGLVSVGIAIFRNKTSYKNIFSEKIILIYGSLIVYFFAHVIFWWKGLFNSFGLDRVMGAILPLSAIVALEGFNFCLSFFHRRKLLSGLITITIIVLVVINPFLENYFPLKPDKEVQLVYEVKKWYNDSKIKNHYFKIFYLHPNLPEALAFDPFDKKSSAEIWGFYNNIDKWGYSVIPDSSIIIWDTHYCPNEGGVQFEKLISDTNFRLVKSFLQDDPLMTLGNKPFEIHVFQKLKREKSSVKIIHEIKSDFESDNGPENVNMLSTEKASSGIHSYKINPSLEFNSLALEKTGSIEESENIRCVKFSMLVLGSGQLESSVVLSFHNGPNQIAYYSFPINNKFEKEEWISIDWHWQIDSKLFKEADNLKMYIWNYKKETFYIDDFDVQYLNQCY